MYEKNTANYPRLKRDVFFTDYENTYKYSGFMDDSFKFLENFGLLTPELWKKFVNEFRVNADDVDAGWRGEYWGKMMRSACFIYSYTKNGELYNALHDSVIDMISTADELGRISTFSVEREFDGWDLWGRKYVLLGMQYFLEICEDDTLYQQIISCMCAQTDYLIEKIGRPEDGKKSITSATRHWRGANSSSILEPIVRLYNITGEQKYFDFAKYIVDCGVTDIANLFDLAFENKLSPYQYPITKAYEIASCFEGLLEFYRITGNERYKTAIINYADGILKDDFTVIGCSGCTFEFIDHSTVRQANTTNHELNEETCVTVTMMKFFYQLTLLTGDPKYVDAFEISLYNAYFGAMNTEKKLSPFIVSQHPDLKHEPLPFDSYSPLTAAKRGKSIGGLKPLNDKTYYGCCACFGPAGIGLVPKIQLLTTKNGFALNLFVNGSVTSRTPDGNDITFTLKTDYPKSGKINMTVQLQKQENFSLLIRNPGWSKTTEILVNGAPVKVDSGYVNIERCWQNGDTVEISLDMTTEAIYPIPYGTQTLTNEVVWGQNRMVSTVDVEDPLAKKHIALRRGPVMLAQDSRLGYSLDTPIDVKVNADGMVDVILSEDNTVPYPCIVAAKVPLTDGSYMTVSDYASAGKLWTEENKIAVWMLTV